MVIRDAKKIGGTTKNNITIDISVSWFLCAERINWIYIGGAKENDIYIQIGCQKKRV